MFEQHLGQWRISCPRGSVDIPGKHVMEITFTVLLLPAHPACTCSTLPRAGMCTASHSTAHPSWLHHTAKWKPDTPALWRESWERGICWSSPLPHWLVGEESMSPLRAMPKSSLARWAICRQVLTSLPRAAAVSKARYASKQAWYWQEHVSLAQPALLLHLAHEQVPAYGLWWQHTPYGSCSLGIPQHIQQAK